MRRHSEGKIAYIAAPIVITVLAAGIAYIGTKEPLRYASDVVSMVVEKGAVVTGFENETDAQDALKGRKSEGTIALSDIPKPVAGSVYGCIENKETGLEAPLYFGDTEEILDKGAGQYMASALPGQAGTTLVSAHNLTYFKELEQLKEGDKIELTTGYGEFVYQVKQIAIEDRSKEDACLLEEKTEQLVLYTCYPFELTGKETKERYFVYCEKISGPTIEE
ncbi:MAG: class D sortase [Lachnospiraceae bacterium]|nr:class D sortase [Lachnospiraceae bacterium]